MHEFSQDFIDYKFNQSFDYFDKFLDLPGMLKLRDKLIFFRTRRAQIFK